MHEISSCGWDKTTKFLTTPIKREEQENITDIESAAWYCDEVGNHTVNNKEKKKLQYAATEDLYGIDGDQSVTTIHERNDH